MAQRFRAALGALREELLTFHRTTTIHGAKWSKSNQLFVVWPSNSLWLLLLLLQSFWHLWEQGLQGRLGCRRRLGSGHGHLCDSAGKGSNPKILNIRKSQEKYKTLATPHSRVSPSGVRTPWPRLWVTRTDPSAPWTPPPSLFALVLDHPRSISSIFQVTTYDIQERTIWMTPGALPRTCWQTFRLTVPRQNAPTTT